MSDDVRRAMELPGFRWMAGVRRDDGYIFVGLDPTNNEEHCFATPAGLVERHEYCWPQHLIDAEVAIDPDDPATAGCLLALLGERVAVVHGTRSWFVNPYGDGSGEGSTLGRACIAAALAMGCWPGGA